jgi:glycosyltransferase involved in cell wall biosynthesis
MKILHVIDQLSQTTAGGSARVCYQMAEQQAMRGHNVTIFTSDWNLNGQPPPQGVSVKAFKTVLNFRGRMKITPGMLGIDWEQFDVLHLHNYRTFTNLAASFYGFPFVLQCHGSAWADSNIFKRLVLQKASALIADAPREGFQYAKLGADTKKIHHIPVGIDMREFEHLPSRRNKRQTILYLGRLHPIKGIDLLIEAYGIIAQRHPQVELRIVGNRAGWTGQAEPPQYGADKIKTYVDADVVVLPSVYEMWGLTWMEALAAGTPVCLTENCEAAGYIPSCCGMVAKRTAVGLAQTIEDMLYKQMAYSDRQKRIDWVSRYSWENVIPQIIDVYREIA